MIFSARYFFFRGPNAYRLAWQEQRRREVLLATRLLVGGVFTRIIGRA